MRFRGPPREKVKHHTVPTLPPAGSCRPMFEMSTDPFTFFLFSAVGLRMVSSGRLGLGLGDSQELKKDWMNGSRFCPFWKTFYKDKKKAPMMIFFQINRLQLLMSSGKGKNKESFTSFINFPGTDLKIFPGKQTFLKRFCWKNKADVNSVYSTLEFTEWKKWFQQRNKRQKIKHLLF